MASDSQILALSTMFTEDVVAFYLGAARARDALLVHTGRLFVAGVTAVIFTTLAIIAIVWGSAHVVVGVPLRRRRPWARMAALMLGSVDLLLLPYGTALGVYALWVLLHEKGKALFEIADRGVRIADSAE